MISKKIRLELKQASLIELSVEKGASESRIKAIDLIVFMAKKENPKEFKVCPIAVNALQADRRFVKCKGQNTLGTSVCEKREYCTRYLAPEALDQSYAEYYKLGTACKKFFNIHIGE